MYMTGRFNELQSSEFFHQGKVVQVSIACGLVLALLWGRAFLIPMGMAGILLLTAFLIAGVARTMLNVRRRSQLSGVALTECQKRVLDLSHEVAELEEARASARAVRDEVQARIQAKDEILATLGHELRTPLHTMVGYSALLQNVPGLSGQHRRMLDLVIRAGEHLVCLSEDLLDKAMMDAGRVTVKNARCDVQRVVRDCAAMLRARADAKNLELLVVELPPFPRFVLCDAGKLRQVLLNLLANAVEHTDYGVVILRASSQPQDNVQHLSLTFEIRDSGAGIAVDDQVRIFEPFFQVSKARGRAGTGLGLSISRQLVQIMGGTIDVQSTPGGGSLFLVNFPVQAAEKPPAEATKDEDNLPPAERFGAVGDLRREALAALPMQLRGELLEAVVRLEARSIAEVIDRVSQQDAELGSALMRCAERYTYTQIFDAVSNTNG
jgi:signal transduction histidine kinase